jgi:hypothetical protein
VIKTLFGISERYKIEDELLVSALSALEADEDSPYQVSLSQIIETYYSAPETCHLAFRLIHIICSIPEATSIDRFCEVWPSRLLKASLGPKILPESVNECASQLYLSAQQALISLCEAIPASMSISTAFSQTLESSLSEANMALSILGNQSLMITSKDLVIAIIKHQVTPLIAEQTLLASLIDRTRCACSLLSSLLKKSAPSAWGLSSVTSLVGILIRLASDGSRRPNRDHLLALYLDLIAILLEHLGSSLKPFYPQLQRLLVNALVSESLSGTAARGLILLLPLLSRTPDTLLSEWCNLLLNTDEVDSSNFSDGPTTESILAAPGGAPEHLLISILEILYGTMPKIVLRPDRLLAICQSGMASKSPLIRSATARLIEKSISTPSITSLSDYSSIQSSLESLLSLK